MCNLFSPLTHQREHRAWKSFMVVTIAVTRGNTFRKISNAFLCFTQPYRRQRLGVPARANSLPPNPFLRPAGAHRAPGKTPAWILPTPRDVALSYLWGSFISRAHFSWPLARVCFGLNRFFFFFFFFNSHIILRRVEVGVFLAGKVNELCRRPWKILPVGETSTWGSSAAWSNNYNFENSLKKLTENNLRKTEYLTVSWHFSWR